VKLVIQDVEVHYGQALGVSIDTVEVAAGEIVGVLGPNGAGKSTLANCVSGILPISAGSIILDERDISRVRAHKRVRAGVVQVAQGRELFNDLTVAENLELGGLPRGEEPIESRMARCVDYFPALGSRMKQPAGSLSGGEQQMLAIGRALMSEPLILILDEPSTGLAPAIVEHMYGVLTAVRDRGVGILLIEQNADWALEVSQVIHVFESQHQVTTLRGDTLTRAALERAYMGHDDPVEGATPSAP